MTRKEIKKAIALDQKYYKDGNTLYLNIINDHLVTIKKCMKHYRWQQYYFYKKNKIMEYLHARCMNHYGNKVGIYIGRECLEPGITIYHQGITINGNARLGSGCKLHGNNCIGNKGAETTMNFKSIPNFIISLFSWFLKHVNLKLTCMRCEDG